MLVVQCVWSRARLSSVAKTKALLVGRASSAVLYDGGIYIYGGYGGSSVGRLGDVHRFDLNSRKFTKVEP